MSAITAAANVRYTTATPMPRRIRSPWSSRTSGLSRKAITDAVRKRKIA
jgi:hypothetical protein